jgi:hypothetical protein
MRELVILLALGLAACASESSSAGTTPEMRGWQTVAGKPPTKAEFTAVVAACEDRAKSGGQNVQINGCMTDLGLRRTQ